MATLDGNPSVNAVVVPEMMVMSMSSCLSMVLTRSAWLAVLAAQVLATSLTSASESDGPGARPMRTADAFVDSIGVNTHLGYTDTIYRRYDDVIRPRLAELGVRQIRDGLRADRKDVIRKLNDLATLGIRSDLLLAPEEAVGIVKAARASVLTVEGQNEPDTHPNWEPKARARQAALYRAVKGDPETANVPVLVSGMANTRDAPGRLGPLVEALDLGNTHCYPGGLAPAGSGGWGISLTRALDEARKVCGTKPLVATETGYHNRTAERGHPGVSEAAAAKYIPRLLLEYFDRGVVRTYLYEFADERPDPEMQDKEQHFGLIRVDGTPKPAFESLRNLIAVLRDPGPTFAPADFAFTLEGDTKDIRHVLLARRDGACDLVVWLEVPSFDVKTRQDLPVAPRELAVIPGRPLTRAEVYHPGQSSRPTAQLDAPRIVPVRVADDPLVIRLMTAQNRRE
jgi:hypothetical protein